MEKVDVPQGTDLSRWSAGQIIECELERVTYYTGHETDHSGGTAQPKWPAGAKSVFTLMHRNAQRPGAYFHIPTAQIMEIGVEFEI